ncbi:hypothetical protein [Methanobrevibacter sp.]|uniref:hypothetical protein n=1 Tax=Methanobrevibacter sp. TaxID=66852 RepID=UPI00388FB04E
MNFQEFEELINSGVREISLTEDVVLDDDESEYLEGINLDVDDLVLDGGDYAIDACGKTRIFFITGKNITIKNITLKNGYGGALKVNQNPKLTLINCGFINNASSSGGAIFNEDGEITIMKSIFNDNTANEHGGAICNINGIINIAESEFESNTAKSHGGAIYSKNSMDVKSCGFHSNEARMGGAVCSWFFDDLDEELSKKLETCDRNLSLMEVCGDYLGYVNIENCEFGDNRSIGGGAISSSPGAYMSLRNCRFDRNYASQGFDLDGGGAIHSNSDMEMDNCHFFNNTALDTNGGAILAESYYFRTKTIIKNSNFKNNNTDMANNDYGESGGAICNKNSDLFLINCNFEDNESLAYDIGESIFNDDDASLSMENCSFKSKKNYCIFNRGRSIIKDCDFYHDFGSDYKIRGLFDNCGSLGIFSTRDNQYLVKLNGKTLDDFNIDDLLFDRKEELNRDEKGFLSKVHDFKPEGYADDEYLENLIENNIKEIDSDLNYQKELVLDSDVFYNPDRTEAIVLDLDNLMFDGKNHVINGNFQQIFNIVGDNICFRNVRFRNASHYRGSVMSLKDRNVSFINCVFEDNFAHMGILYLNDSSVKLRRCKFINNYSGRMEINHVDFGGVILSENGSSLVMDDMQFTENYSQLSLITSKDAYLKLRNSEIRDNESVTYLISDNCTDYSRRHPDILCSIYPLMMDNCDFFENSAFMVYNCFNSFLFIRDSNIRNSEALYEVKNHYYFENNSFSGIAGYGNNAPVNSNAGIESSIKEVRDGNSNNFTYLNNLISNAAFQEFKSIFEKEGLEKIKSIETCLVGDIKKEDFEKEKFKDGIDVCFDNLVIDGQSHTIDADNCGRIFVIHSNHITFKNINFINASKSILNTRKMDVKYINCTFKDHDFENIVDEKDDDDLDGDESAKGLDALFG